MRQCGSEAFVVLHQRHCGKLFLEPARERPNKAHRVTFFAIQLRRMTDNHRIDLSFRQLAHKPIAQRRSVNGKQRISRYAEHIRNG